MACGIRSQSWPPKAVERPCSFRGIRAAAHLATTLGMHTLCLENVGAGDAVSGRNITSGGQALPDAESNTDGISEKTGQSGNRNPNNAGQQRGSAGLCPFCRKARIDLSEPVSFRKGWGG